MIIVYSHVELKRYPDLARTLVQHIFAAYPDMKFDHLPNETMESKLARCAGAYNNNADWVLFYDDRSNALKGFCMTGNLKLIHSSEGRHIYNMVTLGDTEEVNFHITNTLLDYIQQRYEQNEDDYMCIRTLPVTDSLPNEPGRLIGHNRLYNFWERKNSFP